MADVHPSVLVALVGVISGVVGAVMASVVGPMIGYRLEQKKLEARELRRKKEQQAARVAPWRKMVAAAARIHLQDHEDIHAFLVQHPDYWSLEPHLSDSTAEALDATRGRKQGWDEVNELLASTSADISVAERDWDC